MKQKIISFEETLYKFQRDIALAYGVENGVVKIGLEPDLFTRVMLDAHKKSPYMRSFTVVGAAEPQMFGVTILPRERKKEF